MPQARPPRKTPHKAQQREKQGYYAKNFLPAESDDLQEDVSDGLQDEIRLMRVIIRRLFTITAEEAAGLEDWIKAVGTLGSAASRLARLMQVSQQLNDSGDAWDEIHKALDDLMVDLQQNPLPGFTLDEDD